MENIYTIINTPLKKMTDAKRREEEKEKWKTIDPWGGGENFPRPPQDFEPEWFGKPRAGNTDKPLRPRRPRDPRPYY